MSAGIYRHRVQIQSPAKTQDEYGEEVDSWAVVATVWARVEQIGGKEFFDAQRENSRITARITIRHRSGINQKMQLIHGQTIYAITSPPIDQAGRSRQLQLMCEVIS